MGDKLIAMLNSSKPIRIRVTIRSAGSMAMMMFDKAELNGETLTFLQHKGGQLMVNLYHACVDCTRITYLNGDSIEITAM